MAHKLRVTIEPGVVREVDDAELVDLARQGLIHSYEHTDEAAAVLSAHDLRPKVKTWKAPEKGAEIVTAPPAITDPAGAQSTDTKGA